jgi:glutathione gamma-glutamylcysteinyltransferase
VLVLDVARFKYPPHWVALPRLAAAMRTVDPTTGRSRGWLELRRREGALGVGLSLTCAGCSWPEVGRRLRVALTTPWPGDTPLASIAASLVGVTEHCVTCHPDAADHAAAVETILGTLRRTEAHAIARATAPTPASADATAALLLLFARVHPAPTGALATELARIAGEGDRLPLLAAEIDRLAAQSTALRALVP